MCGTGPRENFADKYNGFEKIRKKYNMTGDETKNLTYLDNVIKHYMDR